MTEPLVAIRGLTKRFDAQLVLDDVSFEIAHGEVFGYIGPNGAGKTTTLKILAGLITQYDGEVRIAGVDVARDRAHAHALIGFLPQAAGFQAWRTVDSALDSLAELSGVPPAVRRRRIGEWLERLELTAARGKKVRELSGGMVQKLGLIQALLHEPKLLVLDEPLEGLDPPSRSALKDIIRERQRAGTTVLFSSHILSDVEDVADRVGILHRGKIATSGSLRELATTFGMPVEIELELARPPADLGFLPALGAAREHAPNHWRVVVPAGGDPDAITHAIVERTLAGGGRLRKVGPVEPELDDLFARYVRGAACNATRALVRDELIGFARSKVMIVLWIVLPVVAIAGFLLLPTHAVAAHRNAMSATTFMSVIISSLAGTTAALMIAVDIVSERNRNVFVLFAIRPIRREAIVWAKFLAVAGCVAVACVLSLLLGIVVDALRGVPVTGDTVHDALRGLAAAVAAIALSAAVGALFGVIARSVVVAVILVLYVGQNLAVVPMVPIYCGWLPDRFWITFVISGVLVAVVLWLAGVLFRRAQL